MKSKKQKIEPGDFEKSRDQFTRLRKQMPSKEETLSIFEKANKKSPLFQPKKKIAKDVEV